MPPVRRRRRDIPTRHRAGRVVVATSKGIVDGVSAGFAGRARNHKLLSRGDARIVTRDVGKIDASRLASGQVGRVRRRLAVGGHTAAVVRGTGKLGEIGRRLHRKVPNIRNRPGAAWQSAAGLGALLAALLLPSAALAGDFAAAAGRGTLHAFVFALTAGFLTSLTPCVYPMIPITISVFGARGTSSRGRAFLLATAYVAGIAVMFGTLGTTFALLGRAFGTFLSNPLVVVPLALFFFAMAASMFGAFDLALPAVVHHRLSRVGGRGFAGAFLMGLVGGLIAAPCTGPPLAGILAYVATTRDAGHGFLLLATYAAGIGVPFWAIAGFSMQLPKSGPWMNAIKSVFGIALVVAGLYYLRPVVSALSRLAPRNHAFLIGTVLAICAGLALGAVHLSFSGGARQALRKGLGIALAVAGIFGLVNYLLTPEIHIEWLRSEPAAVATARA